MTNNFQAIRGMNDIIPEEIIYWHFLEENLRQLMAGYAYTEIRFPIVEYTALFKRTLGEVTDIVEKEMYTFVDRNGDSLTLRPEGTAGCTRAAIEHGLLYNQPQRFWYIGPMFRHERPQKGRYRQFYQFGVEAYGFNGPDIDAEQILLINRLWKKLGISDQVVLQINSLGDIEARKVYHADLVKYCENNFDLLDEDSKRRLYTNPIRILDSKNPAMQVLIINAPKLLDYISAESKAHFEKLLNILYVAGVKYEVNPRLVRGLDYYCHTVYEWVGSHLGAQNAICAGGRYDGLVEQLGGKSAPAVGFAIGLERLIELLKVTTKLSSELDAYFIVIGDEAEQQALLLAEELRDKIPGFKLAVNCGGGSFKAQFKRADKSGAKYALILAAEELKNSVISVKNLRHDEPQVSLNMKKLVTLLSK